MFSCCHELIVWISGLIHVYFTCVGIVVSVQRRELFAIMPRKGVSGVAMVTPHPQLVEIGLRLQSEASVLCKDLSAGPVLQRDEQLVVSLVGQPVDVLQPQPVLTVYVAKTLLCGGKQKLENVFWKPLNIYFGYLQHHFGSLQRFHGLIVGGHCVVYVVCCINGVCSSQQVARGPLLFYY